MKLQVFQRQAKTKGEAKQLRREGKIPAVVYAKGHENESIAVSAAEFAAAMRHTIKGRLPTTIFTLIDSKGKKRSAIVKEIQYKVTNYDVIHLDFEELEDKVAVNVKVPIELQGIMDCHGVKMGGVIRQVIRHLRVRCLPKDVPKAFSLDVSQLDVQQTKRLKDIEIANNVRPLADLNEVAVIIAKR